MQQSPCLYLPSVTMASHSCLLPPFFSETNGTTSLEQDTDFPVIESGGTWALKALGSTSPWLPHGLSLTRSPLGHLFHASTAQRKRQVSAGPKWAKLLWKGTVGAQREAPILTLVVREGFQEEGLWKLRLWR